VSWVLSNATFGPFHIVNQCLNLHSFMGHVSHLAFNENILDGFHFELPFLLVVLVTQALAHFAKAFLRKVLIINID